MKHYDQNILHVNLNNTGKTNLSDNSIGYQNSVKWLAVYEIMEILIECQ